MLLSANGIVQPDRVGGVSLVRECCLSRVEKSGEFVSYVDGEGKEYGKRTAKVEPFPGSLETVISPS